MWSWQPAALTSVPCLQVWRGCTGQPEVLGEHCGWLHEVGDRTRGWGGRAMQPAMRNICVLSFGHGELEGAPASARPDGHVIFWPPLGTKTDSKGS